jgi:hypothetical protein
MKFGRRRVAQRMATSDASRKRFEGGGRGLPRINRNCSESDRLSYWPIVFLEFLPNHVGYEGCFLRIENRLYMCVVA